MECLELMGFGALGMRIASGDKSRQCAWNWRRGNGIAAVGMLALMYPPPTRSKAPALD